MMLLRMKVLVYVFQIQIFNVHLQPYGQNIIVIHGEYKTCCVHFGSYTQKISTANKCSACKYIDGHFYFNFAHHTFSSMLLNKYIMLAYIVWMHLRKLCLVHILFSQLNCSTDQQTLVIGLITKSKLRDYNYLHVFTIPFFPAHIDICSKTSWANKDSDTRVLN